MSAPSEDIPLTPLQLGDASMAGGIPQEENERKYDRIERKRKGKRMEKKIRGERVMCKECSFNTLLAFIKSYKCDQRLQGETLCPQSGAHQEASPPPPSHVLFLFLFVCLFVVVVVCVVCFFIFTFFSGTRLFYGPDNNDYKLRTN